MVSFGDSVPSGSRCRCTPFPTQYASKVAAHTGRNIRMINHAFAGATSRSLLQQMGSPLVRREVRAANTALVMVGANDFVRAFNRVLHHRQRARAAYRPVAGRVQTNVITIIRTLQRLRPGIRVLVAGYWNVVKDGNVGRRAYGRWGTSKANQATSYANAALGRAVGATRVTYVSTYKPFKGANGTDNPTRLLASDGDHPNAQGHSLIAAVLYGAAPQG
jgi:acyl-CoA thioesterase-1